MRKQTYAERVASRLPVGAGLCQYDWPGGGPVSCWSERITSTTWGHPDRVNAQMQSSDGSFGVRTNCFGFNIAGARGRVVVVEDCANLALPALCPRQTNTLTGDAPHFRYVRAGAELASVAVSGAGRQWRVDLATMTATHWKVCTIHYGWPHALAWRRQGARIQANLRRTLANRGRRPSGRSAAGRFSRPGWPLRSQPTMQPPG